MKTGELEGGVQDVESRGSRLSVVIYPYEAHAAQRKLSPVETQFMFMFTSDVVWHGSGNMKFHQVSHYGPSYGLHNAANS